MEETTNTTVDSSAMDREMDVAIAPVSDESLIEGGRVYELAYIFVPTLSADGVNEKFQSLKDYLKSKNVEFVSEDIPRLIELQYEMSRTIANKKTWFDEGYFGWIKFEADPSVVKEIHDDLARDEEVIRYMIIKTVRESTIASKKPFAFRARKDVLKDGEDSEVVVKDEVVEKASEEQIDTALDALVSEE
jgi:ribosomal protein S6